MSVTSQVEDHIMAKALLGHVGTAADYRMASELRHLQLRVKELEAELAEARADRVVEAASAELLSLSEPVPAYS